MSWKPVDRLDRHRFSPRGDGIKLSSAKRGVAWADNQWLSKKVTISAGVQVIKDLPQDAGNWLSHCSSSCNVLSLRMMVACSHACEMQVWAEWREPWDICWAVCEARRPEAAGTADMLYCHRFMAGISTSNWQKLGFKSYTNRSIRFPAHADLQQHSPGHECSSEQKVFGLSSALDCRNSNIMTAVHAAQWLCLVGTLCRYQYCPMMPQLSSKGLRWCSLMCSCQTADCLKSWYASSKVRNVQLHQMTLSCPSCLHTCHPLCESQDKSTTMHAT